jgi:ribosomal protein S27AE
MGWRKRWAAWVALRQARRARTRLTFQTCRRCGSYSLLPITRERPFCGGCRSLQ